MGGGGGLSGSDERMILTPGLSVKLMVMMNVVLMVMMAMKMTVLVSPSFLYLGLARLCRRKMD